MNKNMKTRHIGSSFLLAMLMIGLLAACGLEGEQAQVSMSKGKVSVPDLLVTPQAISYLFSNGEVSAVLNVYKGSQLYDSYASAVITDPQAPDVKWDISLSGAVDTYTFEVVWVWNSTAQGAIPNFKNVPIPLAHSTNRERLGSDNTLNVTNYTYDNSNGYGNENIVDLTSEPPSDPFVCVLNYSKLGDCRLG